MAELEFKLATPEFTDYNGPDRKEGVMKVIGENFS